MVRNDRFIGGVATVMSLINKCYGKAADKDDNSQDDCTLGSSIRI